MLNRVILMGRLTADPELKSTPSGVSVTSFSIAVERNFADKSTGSRQADFINIVAWRQTAEFISRYFSKGRMIALEGSIQTRSYEDKNGNKRTAFEVVVDQAYFADSKQSDAGASKPSNNFPTPESFPEPAKGTGFSIGDFEEIDTDDSDLPF
ncbi:single-stranded DNA-binding protein [Paludicola sp. MB14-C6]|uniref:single-stranded DNA-binding protein n=1 Tax=Paludihabitans sp. MB14-C6 TaxID=3070656 RepID=UPI0027DC7684|nr:single-stranded DNA-binding protein [Paludicola sp. MB14-C6]WMJ22794.1 single-stranded DNA-binding protein [Paludicola sp. MB14-C6]